MDSQGLKRRPQNDSVAAVIVVAMVTTNGKKLFFYIEDFKLVHFMKPGLFKPE